MKDVAFINHEIIAEFFGLDCGVIAEFANSPIYFALIRLQPPCRKSEKKKPSVPVQRGVMSNPSFDSRAA